MSAQDQKTKEKLIPVGSLVEFVAEVSTANIGIVVSVDSTTKRAGHLFEPKYTYDVTYFDETGVRTLWFFRVEFTVLA